MAQYDITEINGVTKVETLDGFLYHFPLEVIRTYTALNKMRVYPRGAVDSREEIMYANIDDNLGGVDIEGYADQLALRGFYKENSGNAVQAGQSLADATGSETAELLTRIIELLEDLNT